MRKDPDSTEDFTVNWAPLIGADPIASSEWTIAAAPVGTTSDDDDYLTLESNTFDADAATTTVWQSKGKLGCFYILVNRIVTASGRTEDQSVTIRIREN